MNATRGLIRDQGPNTFHWHRGTLIALGVLNILAGVVALAWPAVTVLVLALLLGVVLLVVGVTVVAYPGAGRSGWTTALGVIAIIAGIICLIHPGAGVFAILVGTAVYFILTGITDLGLAGNGTHDRVLWGLLGVLSIIAGVIMLVDGDVAIVTVALIAGISFLVRGIAELGLAMRLRKAG